MKLRRTFIWRTFSIWSSFDDWQLHGMSIKTIWTTGGEHLHVSAVGIMLSQLQVNNCIQMAIAFCPEAISDPFHPAQIADTIFISMTTQHASTRLPVLMFFHETCALHSCMIHSLFVTPKRLRTAFNVFFNLPCIVTFYFPTGWRRGNSCLQSRSDRWRWRQQQEINLCNHSG